jgi:hypothetical protein
MYCSERPNFSQLAIDGRDYETIRKLPVIYGFRHAKDLHLAASLLTRQ